MDYLLINFNNNWNGGIKRIKMEGFYIWIIIGLLIAIFIRVSQGNKKLSEKEIAKIKVQQEKAIKIGWWIIALGIFAIIIFFLWIYSSGQ